MAKGTSVFCYLAYLCLTESTIVIYHYRSPSSFTGIKTNSCNRHHQDLLVFCCKGSVHQGQLAYGSKFSARGIVCQVNHIVYKICQITTLCIVISINNLTHCLIQMERELPSLLLWNVEKKWAFFWEG